MLSKSLYTVLGTRWAQGHEGGIRRARFGLVSVAEAERALTEAPVPLSRSYLEEVSPARLTIPDVRSRSQAQLYARLHAAHPALGDVVPHAWGVRFRRELDMTNDAGSFHTVPDVRRAGGWQDEDGLWHHPELGELLPVFEGRMVHQYDAAAKGHVRGHGRSAQWEVLAGSVKAVRPRYLVRAEDAKRRGVRRLVRAAFCDITGHANERTVLAALVPAVAACGNKVPTCEFDTGHAGLPALWTAVANSFVIDWAARRRVSTTLNFFHWEEMAFPRIDPDSPVGRTLVDAALALGGEPGQPRRLSLVEQARLRAEVDAEVALLFGLDLADVALVLADFPLLDRGVPEGHRCVTRDLVLAAVAARLGEHGTLADLGLAADRGPTSIHERPRWHAESGAVGYLPGESARVMLADEPLVGALA